MGETVSPGALAADAVLAGVAEAFDYLLYVQPTNSDEAWHQLQASGFEHEPTFAYRAVDIDVEGLQRQLAGIDLDAIDNHVVAGLVRRRRDELNHYLGLLHDRGTPDFLRRSLALSGPVDEELVSLAERVLAWSTAAATPPTETVPPETFVRRAEAELRAYRRQEPALTGAVQIRADVVALTVSRDQLLVPATRRVPTGRVEPLIHHEIGVHVLTWWNGCAQPLRLFADGLGGFLEAQEGLGVLAELLAGGLTPRRLGVLAARVLAARSVIDGATFLETFADLERRGVTPESAFSLTTRVHGGGGLVKDAEYLRGLVRVISYLQDGGDLDLLLLGKPSMDDLDAVGTLVAEGVLVGPRVRPHWLEGEGADRLARLCAGSGLEEVLVT